MDDNGLVVTDTDFLDKHYEYGVGRYNASWDRIEAEWFYEKSDGLQKVGTKERGFHLTNIKDGDFVRFSNVEFEQRYGHFSARVTNSKGGGILEVRKGSVDERVIGKIAIKESASSSTFSCDIKSISGLNDIYIVYKGAPDVGVELDWISFSR